MTVRNAASMGTYGATWQAAGYSGGGNVGPLVGALAKRPAIICGNADGVFTELVVAEAYGFHAPVIFAVNDVGMFLPRVDHWVSLHVDKLGPWKSVRWLNPMEGDTKYHSVDKRPFVDYVWQQLTPCFALSGYFAMQIAWIMGASPIVLCGCPGSSRRRFFEAAPRVDNFNYGAGTQGSDKGVREQLEDEMKRLPDFKNAVRSMSGWTREFFGGL